MQLTLDELIKWILAQFDDNLTDGQKLCIYQNVCPERKVKSDNEQN